MTRIVLLASLLFATCALAQDPAETPPPPPLVDAPPVKESDAPKKEDPPTPPPPGAHLPGGNQTNYPYSPYGAPVTQPQELPVEYGLIATEYLFGVLTAAPIVLLPYLLFLRDARGATGDGAALNRILFLVIFATVPVAIAQTEIGVANGSRYYTVESWPAYLSGFLAQGMVIGLYYLAGGEVGALPETLLLTGSILFVPAVETAAINFMKTPKGSMGGYGVVNHAPGEGWSVGRPRVMPLFTRLADRLSVGVQVPLAAGTF